MCESARTSRRSFVRRESIRTVLVPRLGLGDDGWMDALRCNFRLLFFGRTRFCSWWISFQMQLHKQAAILRDFPTSAELVVSSVFDVHLDGRTFQFCSQVALFCSFYASQTHDCCKYFMLRFYRICFILSYAQYYCIGKIFPR